MGLPAFIVETDRDSTVELSFTPWRNDGWQQRCQVVIRFSDVFEVIDRFCKDVDCNGHRALNCRPSAAKFTASSAAPTPNLQRTRSFCRSSLGARPTLGRVGHAAFAWRKLPDYLFAAYKRVGDSLEPVAGFYISKTRGKPLSATVD